MERPSVTPPGRAGRGHVHGLEGRRARNVPGRRQPADHAAGDGPANTSSGSIACRTWMTSAKKIMMIEVTRAQLYVRLERPGLE